MWTRADWQRLQSAPPPSPWQFLLLLCFSCLGLFLFSQKIYWIFNLILIVFFFLNQKSLSQVNRLWFSLGVGLAWLLQPLFLFILYLVIFVPFGWLLSFFRPSKYRGHWVQKNQNSRFEKGF